MKRLLTILLCFVAILTCLPIRAEAQTPLEILQQPRSCSVPVGEDFSATVVASGDGLRYQWYYREKNSTRFKKSINTTDTYSYPMTSKRDGRKAYCVVSDRYGSSIKTDTVVFTVQRPQITVQPESVTVPLGENATVRVEARGDGLRYQWYYREKNSGSFKKSTTTTTDTYSYPMTEKRDGRKLYCVVRDKNGYTVRSDTVTLKLLKPQITKQPQTGYAQAEETVRVAVEASGANLSYQWYLRKSGSSRYQKTDITDPVYTAVMSKSLNGAKVYCTVTDSYGYSVKSNAASLKLMTPATITKQPKDTRVSFGSTGKISVSAKGDGLTYQWYYRDADETEFIKSTIRKSAYSLTMTSAQSGRYVYCVVTDKYGNSLQSDTARLLAAGKFKASEYRLTLDQKKDLKKQLNFTVSEELLWSSSNPEIVSVSGSGVISGHMRGKATVTVVGAVTGVRATCQVQVGAAKQIAMTFDDGPSTHTARLLNYLETTDAKVTFFMVGNRMNSYKTSVRRIAEQGHELGYHSYDHATQTGLSSSRITADYKKSNRILNDLTGQDFTLWRTPGGSYNSRVLQAVPLPHILWSVDTLDWKTRNETAVYNAIVNHAKDGAIILLHDLHGTSVDGAIRAMKKLQAEGYEFVTVTQLLSRDGTPPKKHVSYP